MVLEDKGLQIDRGIGQQVILQDGLARNAEQFQHECGGEAGAVLARGAVEQQRTAVSAEILEQQLHARVQPARHAAVELDQVAARALQRVLLALDQQAQRGVIERMIGVQHAHVGGRPARRFLATFIFAAQIDDGADAEAFHQRLIATAEMRHHAGAEDLPPAQLAAVGAAIAAEIAKIAAAFKGEYAWPRGVVMMPAVLIHACLSNAYAGLMSGRQCTGGSGTARIPGLACRRASNSRREAQSTAAGSL